MKADMQSQPASHLGFAPRPLLERNAATGHFTVTVGAETITDLDSLDEALIAIDRRSGLTAQQLASLEETFGPAERDASRWT